MSDRPDGKQRRVPLAGSAPDEREAPETAAEAQYAGGRLADIVVRRKGREMLMLGAAGPARERGILPADFPGRGGEPQVLPVLIGSGTGAALEALTALLEGAFGPDPPLAVIDREEDILAASGLRERFAGNKGIFWPSSPGGRLGVDETLAVLTQWQSRHGGKPFFPLLNPFYLRLDREYYAAVKNACDASARADFWSRARYAKFRDALPRILLLTSKYFLMGEFEAACGRLGVPRRLLRVPDGECGLDEFIRTLLAEVAAFRPDFIFTINHLGIDREGALTDLLERLRLPLASWFVDNPHLILYAYARLRSPWTAIFSWDADNLASLRESGFERVAYLPLGTDVRRFLPPACNPDWRRLPGLPGAWNGDMAFVGNSMHNKIAARMGRTTFPPELLAGYRDLAAGFAESDERSVRSFLMRARPDLLPAFDSMEDMENKLGYEAMITWEATRQYRFSCVEGILPFAPLIVGDSGWHELFAEREKATGVAARWHYFPEVNYYDDLPRLYPCAAVNFNCTSKQMKGAVNQRVFDVPAAGAFLLTDYRGQVENLFEPGREVICYHSPEEAGDLARYYLARPRARHAVIDAARARILKEHSYEHRVRSLIDAMRAFFG
jgi:spore maturation protein CgeB